MPVLNIIYPVAIMLILLSYADRWLKGRRMVYPMTILFTGVASILFEVQRLLKWDILNAVPLAKLGLGWVLPALAGLAVGLIASRQRDRH